MHTTIDYTPLSQEIKQAEAIKDCREWLNPTQWEAAETIAKTLTCRQFEFGMMIAGIQGYPVVALYEYLSGKAFVYAGEDK